MNVEVATTITVNGERRAWRPMTVRELLSDMGIDAGRGGVAVAVNAAVVPRGAWDETRLATDDKVEIVRIVRGG
jgi:sulfur carrier protein